jgi:hypothetical protein
MPRAYPAVQSLALWRIGALALVCALAAAAPARAGEGVRWQLQASVPVMCAILDVETRADQPAGLAIATTCNAERYQIVLHGATGQAGLRAARSSAGPVQVSGSVVTITSSRPGYALTMIELTEPVNAGQVAVTLQPV